MAASVNKKQRIDSIDTTDSETNTNTSENSDVSLNVGGTGVHSDDGRGRRGTRQSLSQRRTRRRKQSEVYEIVREM